MLLPRLSFFFIRLQCRRLQCRRLSSSPSSSSSTTTTTTTPPPLLPPTLIISGPSGSGKSTLLQKLFKTHPKKFSFAISHTTRLPRPSETTTTTTREEGCYNFVTIEKFKEIVEKGGFVEYVEFAGNWYGSSFEALRKVAAAAAAAATTGGAGSGSGKRCVVLDIEMEGVKQVKKTLPEARFVFIKPPSLLELRERLEKRGTETPESLQRRLDRAREELEFAKIPGTHDLIIVNDDLGKAYKELEDYAISL